MDYDKLIAPAAAAMRPSRHPQIFRPGRRNARVHQPWAWASPDFKTPVGHPGGRHRVARDGPHQVYLQCRFERAACGRSPATCSAGWTCATTPMRGDPGHGGRQRGPLICASAPWWPRGTRSSSPSPALSATIPSPPPVGGRAGPPALARPRTSSACRPRPCARPSPPAHKLLIMPYPQQPHRRAVMPPRGAGKPSPRVLRGTDIIVLSDEIYAELTLRPPARLHRFPARDAGADGGGQRLFPRATP